MIYLKDFNFEEVPPKTTRIYYSDYEYKDYTNCYPDDNYICSRDCLLGPAYFQNDLTNEVYDTYIAFAINGKNHNTNGRARFWFKDGKLINRDRYIQYWYNGIELIDIKTDEEFFKYLKIKVFE